jgi:glutathione S-transferase
MKLYTENYPAPNPRKVHIYLAEKGIGIERVHVKMLERAHKAPDFLKKNTLGQVPVLETDDGRFISESVAICRYLEVLHPAPPLFGRDALDSAFVEMWIRRAEFRVWNPMGQIWINSDPRTARVVPKQFNDYGEHSKEVLAHAMRWIDGELADGRPFLAGDGFSMADIVLLCGLDFGAFIHQQIPDEAANLKAWHARVSSRPSAKAQAIPGSNEVLELK